MRLGDKALTIVVNFLLGVAWAVVLIGALGGFFSSRGHGVLNVVSSVAIGLLPGLIAVLLLEHFITVKEQLHELKKQNRLLRKLTEENR